ncbi:MAG: Protein N-acetyltransferase, RimJ/RimL family [Chloroflexi bacterium AL-W]|nr:Protein N-acetyltransferase, RimJ/RimL family [Chloroflexi bacterium AL-N1]NOK70438.1 Protein N-acetyltransferase, RimJ/RimL family [Chloroflexi bacterium AL-N10]NOK78203.1 Protein N-acetyltransferase, RimJ/RimL family [Chloroflexi bacterium AL-N5]NOK85302.1 Protein N-acetyltransferase, RimJ/RimL family [Chloroflexi bacterium AL-W]NOK92067.1 Protein N-acetyltransferase, RimJ/RimL family [Chloroflexi bacterium AL-N15]
MHQPTLETTRLILRPFDLTDAPTVQRLAGDAAVADTTLNIPHPYHDGTAAQWIGTHQQAFAKTIGVIFAIVLRETNELCGSISLGITKQHHRAEMGYWLGVPYWNRGYITEAARALLDYGFNELQLHRINAHHLTRNPASGRVMQKIGMTLEGTLREHICKGEKLEDIVCYGIVRHEW